MVDEEEDGRAADEVWALLGRGLAEGAISRPPVVSIEGGVSLM